jgi:hypothetical protein
MTMANAESTTKRAPPHSRVARYQNAVQLLKERILLSTADIHDFAFNPPEEDKELFTLDYLRSCMRIPLPPPPSPPAPRPPELKHRTVRELKVRLSRAGYPCIRVEGRWVEEHAGFGLGTTVSVKIDPGRVVIEPLPDDSPTDPVAGQLTPPDR